MHRFRGGLVFKDVSLNARRESNKEEEKRNLDVKLSEGVNLDLVDVERSVKERERQRERQRDRETERNRQRERESARAGERQRERERERAREREREALHTSAGVLSRMVYAATC